MNVQRDAGVTTITLDRPDRLNALTFDIYRELAATFRALRTEASVDGARAVIITGSGKGFCSGGDVEDIIGNLFARDMAGLLEFTRTTGDLVRAIKACRAPVISAINGVAAGAGAIIAMASDLRIGSTRARVSFLFNKVGLSGADMGACHLLPRIVGQGRATELLLLGDVIGAEEAHRIGFLNRVVEPDALMDEALALARRIADGPAFANAMTKEMLEREADVSLSAAIEMEAQAQAICMMHPDFREAFDAWTDKRAPRFR
jgi:enoyl-CoA hydratase/carnithine racemase